MFQHDREPVQGFAASECLYLRYGREDFLNGELTPSSIRFPRTSVNRSLYSQPEDALFSEEGKYNGLGVVEFMVSCIPPRISQDQGPAFLFFPRHVPLADNFSHSEMWSRQDTPESQPDTYREPSKTVKLTFRIQICRQIRQEQIRIEAVRNRTGG
jgi:hypothetical protein